jgi:hypothetical protein
MKRPFEKWGHLKKMGSSPLFAFDVDGETQWSKGMA